MIEYGLSKNDYLSYCPTCGRIRIVSCYDPAKLSTMEAPPCDHCGYSSIFTKRRKLSKPVLTNHSLHNWVDGEKEAVTFSHIPLRAYQFIWDNYVDIPENDRLIREEFEKEKEDTISFLEAGGYNGIVRYVCPKCKCSTTAPGSVQGFSVGKAAAGVAAFGAVGALAGAAGMNKTKRTCPNCGYKW